MSTTSSINFSLTKKRFKMMMKSFSSIRSGSKGLILIPILLAITLTFCTEDKLEGYTKTTSYNDNFYSNVELYVNRDRADELGIEKRGFGVRFDSSGQPYTGDLIVRFQEDDRLVKRDAYVNGVLKSHLVYDKQGDTLAYYIFGEIGHKFRPVKIYNDEGTLLEEWSNPGPGDSLGSIKMWHPNGQLKYKGMYKGNMQFVGMMTLYDEEGNILEQERYEDGEMVEKIK